jgi:putative ABC transport system permease protein
MVLISHSLWQGRFGTNREIIGRTLTLDGSGDTVVGVLPEQFGLAPTTDVCLPIGQYDPGPDPYRFHEFSVVGRLKSGVRIEQAQTELSELNRQQQQAFPSTHRNFGVQIAQLEDRSAVRMRTALLVLFSAVALVLLVACANFVNLLLARNAARQREWALRIALGATRSRLLIQLVTESLPEGTKVHTNAQCVPCNESTRNGRSLSIP